MLLYFHSKFLSEFSYALYEEFQLLFSPYFRLISHEAIFRRFSYFSLSCSFRFSLIHCFILHFHYWSLPTLHFTLLRQTPSAFSAFQSAVIVSLLFIENIVSLQAFTGCRFSLLFLWIGLYFLIEFLYFHISRDFSHEASHFSHIRHRYFQRDNDCFLFIISLLLLQNVAYHFNRCTQRGFLQPLLAVECY